MRCTLVRHGQTPANVLGQLDTGYPGLPLTRLGLRQAEALPSVLDPSVLDPSRVDLIVVSSLRRTSMTAEPLARVCALDPVSLPELSEISAGSLEMQSDEQSKITYLETVIAWAGGDLTRPMPGGATVTTSWAGSTGASPGSPHRGSPRRSWSATAPPSGAGRRRGCTV